MNFYTHNNQRGFTLLFSILVSTLVISIGATIMSIAIRQTILSGTARESQYAFYAANTALECAFFWDNIELPDNVAEFVFPVGNTEDPIGDQSIVTCAGGNIITGSGFPGGNFSEAWIQSYSEQTNLTTFKMVIQSHDPITISSPQICAEVTVQKTLDSTTGIVDTSISAKGYNTCDLSNPRAVERGIILEYKS